MRCRGAQWGAVGPYTGSISRRACSVPCTSFVLACTVPTATPSTGLSCAAARSICWPQCWWRSRGRAADWGAVARSCNRLTPQTSLLASTPGWLAGGTASLAPLHCKRSGTSRFFSPPELLCTALYWLVRCFVQTACTVQGPRNKGVQRVSLEKSFVLLCTDALPRCFENPCFPLFCVVLMFVLLFYSFSPRDIRDVSSFWVSISI